MQLSTESKSQKQKRKKKILLKRKATQKFFPTKNTRTTIVVGFYFLVSLLLVFLNKSLISEEFFGFPVFVTWIQLIVALVFIIILGRIGQSNPLFSIIPPFEFVILFAQKIIPLSCIYVGMIAFNNLCLYYLEITYYQVVRSLTVAWTVLFEYLMIRKPMIGEYRACAVVISGFFLGSLGEVHFSWLGAFFGILSSCLVSLYAM